MNDYQQRLLNEMLTKLVEVKMYPNINLVLMILFFFDSILVLLGYIQFNFVYIMIMVVTFVGNQHMVRKHKTAMNEYEELKEEYKNYFNDENI